MHSIANRFVTRPEVWLFATKRATHQKQQHNKNSNATKPATQQKQKHNKNSNATKPATQQKQQHNENSSTTKTTVCSPETTLFSGPFQPGNIRDWGLGKC